MTAIIGTWSFNANGSTGSMSILNIDKHGRLEILAQFDGLDRADLWEGVWNDASKSIALTRILPGGPQQKYTGFLGDNDPAHLILAGNFTESDISASAPRTRFGWFAQWQSNIVS